MATKFFNLDTDINLGNDNTSDNIVASQKAIKTYIDNKNLALENAKQDKLYIGDGLKEELVTEGEYTYSSDFQALRDQQYNLARVGNASGSYKWYPLGGTAVADPMVDVSKPFYMEATFRFFGAVRYDYTTGLRLYNIGNQPYFSNALYIGGKATKYAVSHNNRTLVNITLTSDARIAPNDYLKMSSLWNPTTNTITYKLYNITQDIVISEVSGVPTASYVVNSNPHIESYGNASEGMQCFANDIMFAKTPEPTEKLVLSCDADGTTISFTEDGKLKTTIDIESELATKQPVIEDLDQIRSNAKTGADLAPQVEVNTQRIEDLTVSKFPNATPIGKPQVQDSYVSGFSDSIYMIFPFTDISRGLPFDIYFSFTTGSDVTTQQNVLDSRFGMAVAIANGKGLMAISTNGTNWESGSIIGTNPIDPNTTYYVKLSWTGVQYTTAISTDNQTFTPDMVYNNSNSPYKTTIYIGSSPNLFGAGSAHPFKGIINFKGARVYLPTLGIDVWQGMADIGLGSRANVSLTNLDEVGESRFIDLQNNIDTKANNSDLTAHTSNDTIHVTDEDKMAWNNKQPSGDYATNTALTNGLATKENTISDLEQIRNNASAGKSANDTISNYGDIVTYNASDFLSSSTTLLTITDVDNRINASTKFIKKNATDSTSGVITFNGGTGGSSYGINVPSGMSIGGLTRTGYSQYATIRLVNDKVNTGSYYIDGNGSVLFRHKTGTKTAEGSANDAMFTINPEAGIKAGWSGTAGKGITDADLHDVLIDTIEYSKLNTTAKDVLGAINELKSQIAEMQAVLNKCYTSSD